MDTLDNNIPVMLSIKETAQRTGLSAHYLRRLCWDKKIQFVRSGAKYLINLQKLCDYLNSVEE